MPAVFRDRRGEERIQFQTTGTSLATTIRRVVFSGRDFDSLTPAVQSDQFDLANGDLCDCSMTIHMPVRLMAPDGLRNVHIVAKVVLGLPDEDREDIRVSLLQPEFAISSKGDSGWFEDELLFLVSQLPPGFSLQSCITCGLSDYCPAGHGAFGDLACFRDAADDYRLVKSKAGIFAIWSRLTEYVQETHYCSRYEQRPGGRGYRG